MSHGFTMPICILANDIDVPMNVGSLFRLADALGVEKIYLTGRTIRPPNRKIRKTSRSTENIVSYEESDNPILVVNELKKKGYKIFSLEITSDSVDIRAAEFEPNDKVCLIVGSENLGVSPELLAISDQSLHIPMYGRNSSMNVASACSIAVFEIIRRIVP